MGARVAYERTQEARIDHVLLRRLQEQKGKERWKAITTEGGMNAAPPQILTSRDWRYCDGLGEYEATSIIFSMEM